jgi:hypothetical protein
LGKKPLFSEDIALNCTTTVKAASENKLSSVLNKHENDDSGIAIKILFASVRFHLFSISGHHFYRNPHRQVHQCQSHKSPLALAMDNRKLFGVGKEFCDFDFYLVTINSVKDIRLPSVSENTIYSNLCTWNG